MKFPKSMGACADLLSQYREERLEADRHAAELKQRENALQSHIIANLDKSSNGAVGKTHTVRVVTDIKPAVEDWDAFYEYVRKNKAFDLLQKRLGERAVQDRWDNEEEIPGVGTFTVVKVSLTKNPRR